MLGLRFARSLKTSHSLNTSEIETGQQKLHSALLRSMSDHSLLCVYSLNDGKVLMAFCYKAGTVRAPSWSSNDTLAELTSSFPSLMKACTMASATLSPSDGELTTATHVGPAPLIVHPKAPAR